MATYDALRCVSPVLYSFHVEFIKCEGHDWCSGESCLTKSLSRGLETVSPYLWEDLPRFIFFRSHLCESLIGSALSNPYLFYNELGSGQDTMAQFLYCSFYTNLGKVETVSLWRYHLTFGVFLMFSRLTNMEYRVLCTFMAAPQFLVFDL